MPYLIDSDVLIAQREAQPGALALLEQLAPQRVGISIDTSMEVYQGTLRGPDPERARTSFALFLSGVPVIPVSVAAARRCGELREDLARDGKRVRSLALDLITAANALEYGYTLVTRNRKDFEDIPNLSLFQPSYSGLHKSCPACVVRDRLACAYVRDLGPRFLLRRNDTCYARRCNRPTSTLTPTSAARERRLLIGGWAFPSARGASVTPNFNYVY
jgi:predicted nucleic acid-binding protein